MRPRKVVLLVDQDEQYTSVLKFVLETNGFRVVVVMTASEALLRAANTALDLVITTDLPFETAEALNVRLKRMNSGLPIITLCGASNMDETHHADVLLVRSTVSPERLIEQVKVMAARKRGPKKGSKRVRRVEAVTEVQGVA